jgi:hypothetical protein
MFLRQDTIRRALEPPYTSPHKVTDRTDKTYRIVVRGRQVTVSADRVKPAYTVDESQNNTNSSTDKLQGTAVKPIKQSSPTTRSGRTVRFPDYFRP